MRYRYLSFVVLVCSTTVELQLGVGVIALVVLAHPGDEGEVLGVLHAERPREQEVDEAAVFEGKAEVVEVSQDERVGLHSRGLDDAVENHPITVILEDAGGDQLGAVVAAVPFTNLKPKRRQDRINVNESGKDLQSCFYFGDVMWVWTFTKQAGFNERCYQVALWEV